MIWEDLLNTYEWSDNDKDEDYKNKNKNKNKNVGNDNCLFEMRFMGIY